MFRWLILGILSWLLYRLWQQLKAANANHKDTLTQTPHQTPAVEAMVKCAYCELHLPKQEAVTDHTRWFCCPQHKDAYTQP